MGELLKNHNTFSNGLDNDFFFDMDEMTQQIGYSMGKKDAINEIAKKMLKEGLDRELIIKITGLTEENISELDS